MGTRSGIKYVKVFGGWKSSSLRGLVCKAFFFFFPNSFHFCHSLNSVFLGRPAQSQELGSGSSWVPSNPGFSPTRHLEVKRRGKTARRFLEVTAQSQTFHGQFNLRQLLLRCELLLPLPKRAEAEL